MPRVAPRRQKKRANGEGTITHRKDGRWQAALYKPDGDRKFYYGATRDEVHELLIKAQNALIDGLPLPDEKVTLGEYLDYWLDSLRKLGSIRRNTWAATRPTSGFTSSPCSARRPWRSFGRLMFSNS
ncbi:MAG: hypothetical protein KGJ86_04725 [Chloroflexota bacterium]|nr:hypothetical protein [Chloroflexota bacterium]